MELLNKTAYGQPPATPAELVEKRSCPRFPFSFAVEALDPQADTRIKGRLSDISRNGCYMDTVNPFEKDATVTLSVTRDNHPSKPRQRSFIQRPAWDCCSRRLNPINSAFWVPG